MNPYSEIIKLIQIYGASYNPPSIQIGEVISPPPDIVIRVGDLQVDKDNILISDYLLPNYKRQFEIPETSEAKITTEAYIDNDFENVHSITYKNPITNETLEGTIGLKGEMMLTDTLQQGDIIAVLPTEDRQTYIILARLVKLNG